MSPSRLNVVITFVIVLKYNNPSEIGYFGRQMMRICVNRSVNEVQFSSRTVLARLDVRTVNGAYVGYGTEKQFPTWSPSLLSAQLKRARV